MVNTALASRLPTRIWPLPAWSRCTGWTSAGREWPQFFVQLPFNGLPATWGNGAQVSFAAPSRGAVDAAWQAAIANGGIDEGKPGLREHYGPDYYGAYCRDPEGNKLCFVHADGL